MSTKRLRTPWSHELIVSPLGALMNTRFFERLKDRSLPREFRLARASAAAAASVGRGVDAFLRALGGPPQVAGPTRRRLEESLSTFEVDWRARAVAVDAWERAFFGADETTPEERVALETRRRAASERCVQASKTLGWLSEQELVPPVRCETPSPDATLAAYADALADPDAAYGAPEVRPPVEVSRSVPGPAGEEYVVRFASPSDRFDDTVYARVFEPRVPAGAAPTFIYASGLAMAYDQIRYWPEEDYMARPLARRGCRVVLVESPWHGRRTKPGFSSGEPYLGTAPQGLFELYLGQAQETARLIAWARERGSRVVGVGGVSLGGIVSQQIAGRCAGWPPAMRPDVAFLGATSTHIDEVVLNSTITDSLGVDAAVRAAGWTPELLRRLRPLLDPPERAGVPPENVVAVLGRRDGYVPYGYARALLESWGVPDANVVTWDADHFGVLVRLFRDSTAQDLVVRTLERAGGAPLAR
jgi:hypothetical protein